MRHTRLLYYPHYSEMEYLIAFEQNSFERILEAYVSDVTMRDISISLDELLEVYIQQIQQVQLDTRYPNLIWYLFEITKTIMNMLCLSSPELKH